jgi:predicted permease
LRQWLRYDSGFPPALMPDINRSLPKQNIRIVPAGAGVASMKADYGGSLNILLAVCCLVLLIACANVASLLLARGMARRSQTSVRLALGASRGRLIRQSLTESVLLSLAGGLAGLIVADQAGHLILALAFRSAHFLPIDTTPSLPVLAFAFALSLVTGMLFGTAPAWFATHSDPVEALRGANRSTRDSSSLPQRAFLTLQATLSVVLVAGAGMLTRSLINLEHQNFGFETANRVTVNLNSPPATYTPERLDALYRNLEERLRQLPGVERASLALYNPFIDNWSDDVVVQGHPRVSFKEGGGASWDRVSAGYFETIGQPIIRGRGFTEADAGRSAPVAVVNQAFVRRFFPNEDPLGKRFGLELPSEAGRFRIVGVVRDAKYTSPDEPVRPMCFVPLAQHITYAEPNLNRGEMRSHFINSALLLTRRGPGQLEPLLRKVFSDADPNLTIIDVRTMQEQVDLNFDQRRSVADLAGLFGIVALLLAAVGLYGVTAYTVARRTSEIGVRMALGADRTSVIQLVLRGAFKHVGAGLLCGIPLALAVNRLMSSQLYGVGKWDPLVLSVAVISLCICAFTAAIVPATRAAAIDPMTALRTE